MPRRKTQAEFENEVLEKLGPDYKVLGTYVNKTTDIEMIHYVCGNTFMKRPHDVSQKSSGCPYCNGNQHLKYTEDFVIKNTPLPYHYVSGYTGYSKKCLFHCDECGIDFMQSPRRIIVEKLYGCDCQINKKKTNDQFLKELGEECLKEYEVLEEYINIDTPIHFKHKQCDTIFQLTPYQFITRHRKKYCPICYYKKSYGEVCIAENLNKLGIVFQKEFMFPDCKPYKFDFYLPENNMIIEYDGQQHFEAISFFGGEERLLETQKRDQIKNQYCLDHNITLIRIPYTEIDNLSVILYEILKEKSSTTIERFQIKQSSL